MCINTKYDEYVIQYSFLWVENVSKLYIVAMRTAFFFLLPFSQNRKQRCYQKVNARSI
jgi:hypothetical protein